MQEHSKALSHNFYCDNLSSKHKIHATQHDSFSAWSEQRIAATLAKYQRQQRHQNIFECVLYSLFVGFFVLMYYLEAAHG